MNFTSSPTGIMFVSVVLSQPDSLDEPTVPESLQEALDDLHGSMTRDHAAMIQPLLMDLFLQGYRLGTIYSTPTPHSHEDLYRVANQEDHTNWTLVPMHGLDNSILANPQNTHTYSHENCLLLNSGRSPLPGDIVLHHCEMQQVMTLLRAYILLPRGIEHLMPESQMDPNPTHRVTTITPTL